MAKIHKISGYVVDIDETFDVEDLKYALDVMEFIALQIHIETANIGEWNDDNPLNHLNCDLAECEKYFSIGKIIDHVEAMPTVDAEPVRHSIWSHELDDETGWMKHTCSNCGYIKHTDVHVSLGWSYCPECGAKMEVD